MDTVLEDTQPFSQPLIGRSPGVHHSLPYPSLSAERTVSRKTQSSGPVLQNNREYVGQVAWRQAKLGQVLALVVFPPRVHMCAPQSPMAVGLSSIQG